MANPREPKLLRNADQPTMGEIMSDPEYLAHSRAMRKVIQEQETLTKRALGFRNPGRQAEIIDHASFAESILSADEAQAPSIPISTNPRFRRG